MYFSSFPFILLFLPALLLGWCIVGRVSPQYLPRLLLASSLLFAALWYKNLTTIGFMGTLFFINYAIVCFLRGSPTLCALVPSCVSKKSALVFGLMLNALPLVIVLIQPALHTYFTITPIPLPAGAPFFVLMHMALLVTVYQKAETAPQSIMPMALFSSFFPAFLGGPLLRYEHMAPQLHTLYPMHESTLSRGITRFALGFCKAVFFADALAPLADFSAAHAAQNPLHMWLATLAFTLHIYFAFSAYTDMALGVALMLGIWLPENFASPYKAENIIEFWRRWHITLSSWMRDFLYVPLKGRCSPYVSVVVIMLLCGLWSGLAHGMHGGHVISGDALFTFALWGIVHGVMLACNYAYRALLQKYCPSKRLETIQKSLCLRVLGTVCTFACVMLAWVIFGSKDVGVALESYEIMGNIFLPSWWQWGWPLEGVSFLSTLSLQDICVLIFACAVTWLSPNCHEILNGTIIAGRHFKWTPSAAWAWSVAMLVVTAVLFQGAIHPIF